MKNIPTKREILDWINQNPTLTAKRDIAKAFGIKGAARIDLKRVLKELESEGHLQKRNKTYRDSDQLAPVSVLTVLGPDHQGDVFATPLEWPDRGQAPKVLLNLKSDDPAIAEGDRILAKVQKVSEDDYAYTARIIRRIRTGPKKILGIFRKRSEGGRITPIDKGMEKEWAVKAGHDLQARDGELVEAEQVGPKGRLGLALARVNERLGDPSEAKAVSLIAVHQHGIPDEFSEKVLEQVQNARPAGLNGREDLRHLPLVTIDPPDARDHDDAVYVEADANPKNEGGFIIWVAIADVAHYVRPDTALDREAYKRGNSSYFPDRVVPMLPDRLSGDLCSLHEDVPRACLVARMTIDKRGQKIAQNFIRGLMKSAGSLSYEQVQKAYDGAPDEQCAPLMADVIEPLYGAYRALVKAREKRQPLNLDLPERKVKINQKGKVESVDFSPRFDAHKLIEEFMVLANVAAAEELEKRQRPLLYRVHEEPAKEKLDQLREVAQASGFVLAKGQVLHSSHLNRLLEQASGSDHSDLINISTLRSMTQAYYHPENYGHFGLALRSYAHFTSPIRRYADLLVHRALISAHGWGDDGLDEAQAERMDVTAKHISSTERRSMLAERDTTDRYLAAYLKERIGMQMGGSISGIQSFGIFVKLDETGADGLVPVRSIGNEYFVFDPDRRKLKGSNSGLEITIGQRVEVQIKDAVPITGGLELELLSIDGASISRRSRNKSRAAKGSKYKKANKSKIKNSKIKKR